MLFDVTIDSLINDVEEIETTDESFCWKLCFAVGIIGFVIGWLLRDIVGLNMGTFGIGGGIIGYIMGYMILEIKKGSNESRFSGRILYVLSAMARTISRLIGIMRSARHQNIRQELLHKLLHAAALPFALFRRAGIPFAWRGRPFFPSASAHCPVFSSRTCLFLDRTDKKH